MDPTCVDLTSSDGLVVVSGFAVVRGVLLVLDSLKARYPALRPAADSLGTVLGGKQARFAKAPPSAP